MSKKDSDIYLGGGANLNFKASKIITTHNTLKLVTPHDGAIELDVRIEADFGNIPEKYHEVFLNMVSAKYLESVSFGDNPFSQCIPAPKKQWWQFWKASVNI